ncbi:MAG: hypothetical protein AAGH89_03590 [Verrucomicrobiota bacterium]
MNSEFDLLVERLRDNDLDSNEQKMLSQMLAENPKLRKRFVRQMAITAGLQQRAEYTGQDSVAKVLPFPVPREPNYRNWALVSGVAAALVMIGFALSYLAIPGTSAEIATTPVPKPDFVLTRAIDVVWEHKTRFQAEVGQPITEKYLRVISGILEIQFASGAVATIEGPAKFRLDSPMNCFSHHGKLAVYCPQSAYGFMVRFPGGRITDLGTEFALNSEPGGKTDVHVLDGEVIVSRTDDKDRVLSEQNLLGNSAVKVGDEIEAIAYDDSPFEDLKRGRLIQSQPIKLQFDLGHRAGLYTGTNAPAHAAGDMFSHENVWTQIVGDQSGAFVMADGNLCPHPIKVDYGHGDGEIDWDAAPVDPWGNVYSKARGVLNSPLCQDHRPWDFDLGLRVSGLPAGKYRIYALCRSVRRPDASYDVSFGVNLDQQLSEPTIIPPMADSIEPSWEPGLTYAVGNVAVNGPEDWATFITRYSRERSVRSTPHHGRSVLLGLQIVEIR